MDLRNSDLWCSRVNCITDPPPSSFCLLFTSLVGPPRENRKFSVSQGFGQSLLSDLGSQPFCGSLASKTSPLNFHSLCCSECCHLRPSVGKDTIFTAWLVCLGRLPHRKTTDSPFFPSVGTKQPLNNKLFYLLYKSVCLWSVSSAFK